MKTQQFIDTLKERKDLARVAEVISLAEAVRDDLATLRESQLRTFATAVITSYKLAPDEVLVVKLGDKETGWIPSPEEGDRVLEMFRTVMKSAGITNEVLLYNYGLELEVVKAEQRERAQNFWVLLRSVAGRTIDWRPVAGAAALQFGRNKISSPLRCYAAAVAQLPEGAQLPNPITFFQQAGPNPCELADDPPLLAETIPE